MVKKKSIYASGKSTNKSRKSWHHTRGSLYHLVALAALLVLQQQLQLCAAGVAAWARALACMRKGRLAARTLAPHRAGLAVGAAIAVIHVQQPPLLVLNGPGESSSSLLL